MTHAASSVAREPALSPSVPASVFFATALDVVALVIMFPLDWGVALVAHGAIAITAAVAMARASAAWGVTDMVCCLLLAVAGPIGGVAGLYLTLRDRRAGAESCDMLQNWQAWYARDIVHDDMSATDDDWDEPGREFRPGAAGVRRLPEVMTSGTFRDKQAVLGLVALRYDPSYLDLLHKGLRASESGIRAQAASIYVKLDKRHRLMRDEAIAILDGAPTATDQAHACRLLATAAASGFLDAAEADLCHAALQSLVAPPVDVMSTHGGIDDDTSRPINRQPHVWPSSTLRHQQALRETRERLLATANSFIDLGEHRSLHDLITSRAWSDHVVSARDLATCGSRS